LADSPSPSRVDDAVRSVVLALGPLGLAVASLPTRPATHDACAVTRPGGAGIQAAIDACAAKGGGIVAVPRGERICGPLWLKENVELRLATGAPVKLSHDPRDWTRDARVS
jgi:polygalacturonase